MNVECPQYDASKSDYLEQISCVDILVEDHTDNAQSANNMGVQGLLVSKPWNDSKMSLGKALDVLEARISCDGV